MKSKNENKAKILREFIKESGADLDAILSKYEKESFIDGQNKREIFENVVKGTSCQKTQNYLNERLGTKQFNYMRDIRSPAEYGEDLILAWLKEDVCLLSFENIGLKVSLEGVDRNREFLKAKKVKSSSDLLVQYKNASKKIELIYDATQFWKKSNACHLRDDKFNKIKNEQALILGISLFDKEGFVLGLEDHEIANNSITINYIEYHHFYRKPAYELSGVRKLLGPWRDKLSNIRTMLEIECNKESEVLI